MDFKILYHELENSTGMIRSLLAGITQEEAQVRPSADSWSILEVVCHLHDEELEDFREHLDFILHRQGEEWHEIDPQGWVLARNYNQQDFTRKQADFFEERRKSLEWIQGLSESNWEIEYTSPFGSMKAGGMLASWIAHDNLHIRQLVELRRARIEEITQPYPIGYAGDW
jgi:hypothetical protein